MKRMQQRNAAASGHRTHRVVGPIRVAAGVAVAALVFAACGTAAEVSPGAGGGTTTAGSASISAAPDSSAPDAPAPNGSAPESSAPDGPASSAPAGSAPERSGSAPSEGGDEMKDPVPDGLLGSVFTATEVQGREAVSGKPLTIEFPTEGTRVSLNAGCNGMGGTPQFDGDSLAVPQIISTMMACTEDGVMEQEGWYNKWLTAGVTWTLEGETLTLTGDTVTVTFERSGDAGQGRGSSSETSGENSEAPQVSVISPQSPKPGVSQPLRPTMGGDTTMPPANQ